MTHFPHSFPENPQCMLPSDANDVLELTFSRNAAPTVTLTYSDAENYATILHLLQYSELWRTGTNNSFLTIFSITS